MGDGLEGNFWEEGLPLCVQSRFECLHGCSGHNTHWQLVPVWDYSDAERMLATMSLTPLLVNLQSMTSKPSAGGGSKYHVTRNRVLPGRQISASRIPSCSHVSVTPIIPKFSCWARSASSSVLLRREPDASNMERLPMPKDNYSMSR